MTLCKPLLASAFATLSMLAVDASAATVRVTCEVRPSRSKISIDGKGLAAGTYTTVAVSGANMASHPPVNTAIRFSFGAEGDDDASSDEARHRSRPTSSAAARSPARSSTRWATR